MKFQDFLLAEETGVFLFFSTSGAVNRVNISASTVVEFIFCEKGKSSSFSHLAEPSFLEGEWSVVNSRGSGRK